MRIQSRTFSKIAGMSLILFITSVEAGDARMWASAFIIGGSTVGSQMTGEATTRDSTSDAGEKKIYVNLNKDQILVDMAKGKGEYLSSLAYLHGCPINTHVRFGEVIRANYSQIYSDFELTTEDLIKSIGEEIYKDTQLTGQCTGSML